MRKYRFLSHTADMKFQAFGKNIAECFANAAYALKEIITKDGIKKEIKKEIKINGKDIHSLLYNFLEEFLFLLDSKGFIASKVDKISVDLKKFKITAVVYGDNVRKYKTIRDVKAITYNDMLVRIPSKDGGNKFVCQVVVDV